jgi:MATE family multidrug resistance protein
MGLRGAAIATSINQLLTPLLLLGIMAGTCCFRRLKESMIAVSAEVEINNNEDEKDEFLFRGKTSAEFVADDNSMQRHSDPFLKCWQGWSIDALNAREMIEFLRLGGAGLVMIMEWWASEIAILMSGLSDGSQGLSAMSLYQMTNSFCFMFSKGFEVSTSTRVGIALGAARPRSAQRAAAVGPGLAFLESSVLAVLLLFNRHNIPLLFTGTATVAARATAARVTTTYPFLACYIIADATSSSLGGAITGCGRQRFAALVVIVAYGVIGLPVCALLAFRYQRGYLGIVFGMTLGTFLQCCGNAVITFCTDWKKESIAAVERTKRKSTPLVIELPLPLSQCDDTVSSQ